MKASRAFNSWAENKNTRVRLKLKSIFSCDGKTYFLLQTEAIGGVPEERGDFSVQC